MTDLKKQVAYWQDSAKRNFQAAKVLFRNKHYDSCLFFCHLSIEKMLKGLVVIKTKQTPPYIHNLEKLARLSGLELSPEQVKTLRIITDFNTAGRYMEEKAAFYNQCTSQYTKQYLNISKDLFLWLAEKYPKE